MRLNGEWNGRDLLRVIHLGLHHRELLVIRSIIRRDPELGKYYTLCDAPDEEPADICLVNADNPEALERLESTLTGNTAPLVIYVSAHDRHPEGITVIRKPIVFRKLLDTLTRIVYANTPESRGAG